MLIVMGVVSVGMFSACKKNNTDNNDANDTLVGTKGLLYGGLINDNDTYQLIGYKVVGYIGNETKVIIPSTDNGLPVTSIGSSAFYGCSALTSVTMPNNITSIGDLVFYNCKKLTSITIPNSVKSIGVEAFDGCTGLT